MRGYNLDQLFLNIIAEKSSRNSKSNEKDKNDKEKNDDVIVLKSSIRTFVQDALANQTNNKEELMNSMVKIQSDADK